MIDAHVHLWDSALLDYDWLSPAQRRRFGPLELQRADPSGAERVFVQAECRPEQAMAEIDWVEGLADEAAIVGIVAYAPLGAAPAVAASVIEDWARRPRVVGVRRLLQTEPIGFSRSREFVRSARHLADRGLCFDACVVPAQIGDVTALADAVPELRIVLDHLGKPDVPSGLDPAWSAALRDLGQRPNVSVKLSGLPAQVDGPWRGAQMHPFFDVCLEAFGADRLLYGSDWPVSQPLASWRECVSRWARTRLGEDGATEVMGGTARRIYGL